MKREILRMFAHLMLPIGLVILILSVWIVPFQEGGSAERLITLINIALGSILTVLGVFLILRERHDRKDS